MITEITKLQEILKYFTTKHRVEVVLDNSSFIPICGEVGIIKAYSNHFIHCDCINILIGRKTCDEPYYSPDHILADDNDVIAYYNKYISRVKFVKVDIDDIMEVFK